MRKTKLCIVLTLFFVLFLHAQQGRSETENGPYDLTFKQMPTTWDEGIPLGNGMIGELVWQKDGKLRFSLDRADLWDLRPMENLSKPEFSFKWVQQQVEDNNYKAVQQMFDVPYDRAPAPSKIPGAALEFDPVALGELQEITLSLQSAICNATWKNGAKLESFVHATQPVGWFRFTNVPASFSPELVVPPYRKDSTAGADSPVTGQDLQRLGYEQGKVSKEENRIVYRQKGWGGFEYEVAVAWKQSGKTVTGVWSVSSTFSEEKDGKKASGLVSECIKYETFDKAFKVHSDWWRTFHSKSSISIPDPVLEKQWYLEQYKFGSVARADVPPISLQAVWTADNGKLPPWKGDFHHDLNTQLSYWPAYSANHLDLEEGFLNWLWDNRETFKKYTRDYFGTDGMNVPGVTTLTGEPMGGWIQYSLGPTVGCWLGQHFYLHWKYSGDEQFLREKAYPWIKDAAVYLEQLSVKNAAGKRQLPLSSSPEMFDNSIKAWFKQTSNFDLALVRWTFEKASELAGLLNLNEEAAKWKAILAEWPDFALDDSGALEIAPGVAYTNSHRHFSHLVGWHPLGVIDWSNGGKEQEIIRKTLKTLENGSPDYWVGYSYSWLGNLYARAFMGDEAARTLRIFAEHFCLPNSFHANGDQTKQGFSKFTYRPFTLEGNFAFAAGIQEMLLQSHTGIIVLFPAIPNDWQNASFNTLRAQGGFLVTAQKANGKIAKVSIASEKGGVCKISNPFPGKTCRVKYSWKESGSLTGDTLSIEVPAGETIELME
ncbi:glycoside hydrolase N-terminal domain-containing protein [Maribellus sp. CM-23]|uniref:glycoside hydrolase family 95 protein n=1 Tax=Maribellus sp. CM-23 TaxID=2781026 RepID=UPI001F273A44|nr:glycoside hydrolase family 95 protein [Maribellus sp. CM-23]MCE4563434.1 glycoside hydrolase N-terminal domain-containing protein [Maribellus sp. CM-23]